MAAMPASVLIVDDDVAFRKLATRIVGSWGHVVVGEAGTVAEAVALAAELKPDAALVDVGLPDGDGLMLAERLRGAVSRLRVVLISSDADAASSAAVHHVGAVGFVPKDELPSDRLRRLIAGE